MKYLNKFNENSRKFNEAVNHNRVDQFLRKVNSLLNNDEYEQGDEPTNSDLLSEIGELYNDMDMTPEDLRMVVNSNRLVNDDNNLVKIILDEVVGEKPDSIVRNENSPIEKTVVYCRAYEAGDSYVGDKWFMTEEEAWDVKEGEPNVMRVETYIGSNAHNAALKNERIR